MGTSSSLFNTGFMQLESSGLTGVLRELVNSTLQLLSINEYDIADYSPNPFFGVNPGTNPSARTRDLTLVDGGLDLENIPLHPLIQPSRNVDVIFAMDNSADTVRLNGDLSNWPNGTAMIATYERSISGTISNGTLFPAVPDVNTFIGQGLNNRPTFFGCNASNITTDASKVPPLIVYIPNSPYTFLSNISTSTLSYTDTQRNLMIENGYNIATRGNGTFDSNWAACVGCAIVRREQERQGAVQTAQCQKCFADYCWDGIRQTVQAPEYDPSAAISAKSAAGRTEAWGVRMFFVAAVVSVFVL